MKVNKINKNSSSNSSSVVVSIPPPPSSSSLNNNNNQEDEIEQYHEKIQFLFNLLEKASNEREDLLSIINEQKEMIEKLSMKTSLEEKAFRKVLTEERSKFDKRILRNKSMMNRRDQLLCEWAEIGTMILMTTSNEQLSNTLQKTCLLLPEAKKVSSRRYVDLLHHPNLFYTTPGGGTILESEHEDEDSEINQADKKSVATFPSLHLSLSGGTLTQQNIPDNSIQINVHEDGLSAPPTISPAPSLSSSIYTQGTYPSQTLQSILFGDNLDSSQKNQSIHVDDVASLSLYDLSQSISSSHSQHKGSQSINSTNIGSNQSVETEKKKKKPSMPNSLLSSNEKKESKDKSSNGNKTKESKELENLLGVSLSSLNSVTSDKMGITVVNPNSNEQTNIETKKIMTPMASDSSKGAKKYWWDHLVDADVNTDADGDIQHESESMINLGDEIYDSVILPGGNDNVYDDEIIEDEEERQFERDVDENN